MLLFDSSDVNGRGRSPRSRRHRGVSGRLTMVVRVYAGADSDSEGVDVAAFSVTDGTGRTVCRWRTTCCARVHSSTARDGERAPFRRSLTFRTIYRYTAYEYARIYVQFLSLMGLLSSGSRAAPSRKQHAHLFCTSRERRRRRELDVPISE